MNLLEQVKASLKWKKSNAYAAAKLGISLQKYKQLKKQVNFKMGEIIELPPYTKNKVVEFKEDLEKLLNLCKQIIEDPSKGEELLPTRSGFFFGGTEYDEYYMNSIEHTINILEEVLSEVNERGYLHGEIYYSSSW